MRGTFDNEIRETLAERTKEAKMGKSKEAALDITEGANPVDAKRKMPMKKSKPIRKTSQGGPPGKGMDTGFQPYNAGTNMPNFPKSKSMTSGTAHIPAGFHRQAVLKGGK